MNFELTALLRNPTKMSNHKKLTQFLTVAFFSISHSGQTFPSEADFRAAVLAGGVVKFSSPGSVYLSAPIPVSIDVTIDGDGNMVTLDGQGLTRIIDLASGVRLRLKDLVLANGMVRGVNVPNDGTQAGAGTGGAIRSDRGILVIENCVFTNNYAEGGSVILLGGEEPIGSGGAGQGGAIWQNEGSLEILGGRFIDNSAHAGLSSGEDGAKGGAIFAVGTAATIQGVSFSSNRVVGGQSKIFGYPIGVAEGGAIYINGGSLDVSATSFSNNGASRLMNGPALGGAIATSNALASVSNSVFTHNDVFGGSASPSQFIGNPGGIGAGGAILVGGNSSFRISGSSFIDNVANGGAGTGFFLRLDGYGIGGAIYNEDGSLTLLNSTFHGNSALNWDGPGAMPEMQPTLPHGAAILSRGRTAATNITVLNNTSRGPILSGFMSLKNSLVGSNKIETSIGAGEITDLGHNLSATESPRFTHDASHNNADLKLGDLGDYGGPTPTIPLLAGSVAIDAGDDSAAPSIDQRGRPRPFGLHSDCGAFESSPPYIIAGQLKGHLTDTASILVSGSSLPVEPGGSFRLALDAGVHSIQFVGPSDVVFRPNPLVIDVTADMRVQTRAFKFGFLAFDPDFGQPTFTFAASGGQTWTFFASNDLDQWTPVYTNTFVSNLYSMPLTNLGSPVFMKGIQK